jgi:type IV pilus assembly protein PilB
MARKKLGEMLMEEGVIDETGLRAALAEQQRWGGLLGRVLVDLKVLDERTLVQALSRQLHVPMVDLDTLDVPRQVLELVSGEYCEQYNIVPFDAPMKFLDLAMADPTNQGICEELQIRTRLNVRPHLAGPKAIERAIGRLYGRGTAFQQRRNASPTGAPIDVGPSRGERMEITRGNDDHRDGAHVAMPSAPGRDAEIASLQQRVSRLEALMERDENVLRKMLALLVDKNVASRDEILERLK